MSVEGREELECWNNRSASTRIASMLQDSNVPVFQHSNAHGFGFRVSGANRDTRFGMRDISDLASRITCSYWVLFRISIFEFRILLRGFPVR